MYRYVQTEEKGSWKPMPVTKNFQKELEQAGVVQSSILAVSDIVGDDTAQEDLGYLGPMYFDVDVAGNIALAISSTQELVVKLRELEVPDEGIQVYCSGSKGFHVIVPESLFLPSNRAIKKLPYIYMELARDLYVTGLDFAVYSGGRGRLFRPENGARPDGKFRVRVSLEELDTMTPEVYKRIVSEPRSKVFPGPNGHKAYPLQAMFERAKKRAASKVMMRGTALPMEELQPYAEEPPACVDKLSQHEVKKGTKFNLAGLQLAAFLARSGAPDYKVESLISMMADSGESGTYDTPMKRKVHLQGLVSYARSKPSLAFTCAAMRSITGNKVCSGCGLNNKTLTETSDMDEDGAVLGVVAHPEGYYLKRENGETRISTFTMHPTEVYLDQGQGGGAVRRVGSLVDVYAKHERLGSVYFDEIGWRSKSEFLKQMEGLGDISFLGTDTDIQRLKFAVYRHTEEDEVEEVVNVYASGVHISKIGAKKLYTYVEPGLSINTFGIQGTHRLQGEVKAAPQLRKSTKPVVGDKEIETTLKALMNVNAPEVVAQILGWHAACHLKAHIVDKHNQFPILNLWGAAGSGKSVTSALFNHLNGVDYFNGGSPIQLATSSALPVITSVASTTTVPRLLEEFNQSQIKKYGMYEMITEVLKSAWNNYPVPRGMLSRGRANGDNQTGTTVKEWMMSAPIILCSEQAPQKPALQQRMIQCQLTTAKRQGCTADFRRAKDNCEHLLSFSRALTMMALKTKDEWLNEQFALAEEMVPEALVDRPRFSYTIVFLGLAYFHAVCNALNLDLEDKIAEMRASLYSFLDGSAVSMAQEKTWSEVDIFLSSVAEMAQLSLQNSQLSPLVQGTNFVAIPQRDELVLDLRIVYPMYRRHAKMMSNDHVFGSIQQLLPLLKSESYFVTDERVIPAMAGARKLWVLSLAELEKKGHDTSMFVK